MFGTDLLRTLRRLAAPAAVLAFPALASAAGGGDVEALVFVADSRTYSGAWAWFTNLYNESTVWFTVVTVAAIPITGAVLGLLADFAMSRIGIDLKSRAVAEH